MNFFRILLCALIACTVLFAVCLQSINDQDPNSHRKNPIVPNSERGVIAAKSLFKLLPGHWQMEHKGKNSTDEKWSPEDYTWEFSTIGGIALVGHLYGKDLKPTLVTVIQAGEHEAKFFRSDIWIGKVGSTNSRVISWDGIVSAADQSVEWVSGEGKTEMKSRWVFGSNVDIRYFELYHIGIDGQWQPYVDNKRYVFKPRE